MIIRIGLALAVAIAGWAFLSTVATTESHAAEAGKPAVEIVMYTTKTCGYCARARAWLSSHNLEWDERDIEASAQARDEWTGYGGQGTPLILINGKRFHGFMAEQLEVELARYR